MRHLLLPIYRGIAHLYLRIFGRRSLQPVNNLLLNLALQARGYGNYQTLDISGEKHLITRIAKLQPTLCLDVGANKGHYSEALLQLTQSKVIAFEPLPKAFERLKQIQAEYAGRFEGINKAVGATQGTMELHFGQEDSEVATLVPEINALGNNVKAPANNRLAVEIISLDHFIATHLSAHQGDIDFVKIDTESFEYEVLKGAERTIAERRIKCIQMEFNYHHLFRDHSMFRLAGLLPEYRLYQLLPYHGGLMPIDPQDYRANLFAFSNFVFVRPDITL